VFEPSTTELWLTSGESTREFKREGN